MRWFRHGKAWAGRASTLVILAAAAACSSTGPDAVFGYAYDETIVGWEEWSKSGRRVTVAWEILAGTATGEAESLRATVRMRMDRDGRVQRASYSDSSGLDSECSCREEPCPFTFATAPWQAWAARETPPQSAIFLRASDCSRREVTLHWSGSASRWTVGAQGFGGVTSLAGDETGVLRIDGPMGIRAERMDSRPVLDSDRIALAFRPSVLAQSEGVGDGAARMGALVTGTELERLELSGGRQESQVACGGTRAHVSVLPLSRDSAWTGPGPESCAADSLEECVREAAQTVYERGNRVGADCEWHAAELVEELSRAGIGSRAVTGLRFDGESAVWHAWVELPSGRAIDATLGASATRVPASWVRLGESGVLDVLRARDSVNVRVIPYTEAASGSPDCPAP